MPHAMPAPAHACPLMARYARAHVHGTHAPAHAPPRARLMRAHVNRRKMSLHINGLDPVAG